MHRSWDKKPGTENRGHAPQLLDLKGEYWEGEYWGHAPGEYRGGNTEEGIPGTCTAVAFSLGACPSSSLEFSRVLLGACRPLSSPTPY